MEEGFQALLAAFAAADPERRGLSYQQFQAMLAPLALPAPQLQALTRASDFNVDGRITYAEFVPLACQLSSTPTAQGTIRPHSPVDHFGAGSPSPYESMRPPAVCVPRTPVQTSVGTTPVRFALDHQTPPRTTASGSPPASYLARHEQQSQW